MRYQVGSIKIYENAKDVHYQKNGVLHQVGDHRIYEHAKEMYYQ